MSNQTKFKQIQEKFYGSQGIDLKSVVHEIVNFQDIDKKSIKCLKDWLKSHSDIYKMEKVILYHGTSSEHQIEDEGIKKTTSKTKRSLQSEPGFVYLSMYPESAKSFAEMGYPGKDIAVYAVEVLIKDLVPDSDQLKNKRMWTDGDTSHIGRTLADSLIYGSGARVKRDIEPYEVRDVTHILFPKKDAVIESSSKGSLCNLENDNNYSL